MFLFFVAVVVVLFCVFLGGGGWRGSGVSEGVGDRGGLQPTFHIKYRANFLFILRVCVAFQVPLVPFLTLQSP